jgi:hypothetical protein
VGVGDVSLVPQRFYISNARRERIAKKGDRLALGASGSAFAAGALASRQTALFVKENSPSLTLVGRPRLSSATIQPTRCGSSLQQQRVTSACRPSDLSLSD